MKKVLLFCSILSIVSCKQVLKNQKDMNVIKYPKTEKNKVVDEYFGTQVPDAYRWLEDDLSKETALWVKAQNDLTFSYLNNIPYRNELKKQLEELWNYEKIGAPFTEGDFTYFYKNNGLQNQSVLFQKNKNGNEEVFLDPNTFSSDGTTSLSSLNFTKDGKFVAYQISEGGSDWRKIIVLNTENKKVIGETLTDVKFSNIVWKNNEGFFYSSYDKPQGSELSSKTDQHKLYYHKLNTPQKEDILIFGGNLSEKHRYVSAAISDDNKYIVVSGANSTSGNDLFIKKLDKNEPFIPLMGDYKYDMDIIDFKGDNIYMLTNYKAPNRRLVIVNVNNPKPENWKDIIPETKNVLSVSIIGENILAQYMVDAVSKVQQFDIQGNFIREIELPSIGTASNFIGKENDKEIYYYFTNYFIPSQIYKLNLETGKSQLYWTPKINFDTNQYHSEQVFYTSKDGTKIPMIITYKKGIKKDGQTPTILYGYGGFNVSLTPSFSVSRAVWLQQGGILAVANLRGGGEYGKEWHDAGTKKQKQNVFNDFIAAGEYLIKNKYTSSEKLAIQGGSNGGLLVGAVMTQRPDLMKVALPAVGVLDMLRYHKFTAGAGWAYDYGTADESKEMFEYLKKYSPLHNVKEGVCYPATLITTGDHDDRVVPAHSFKFAAELQAKQKCQNPTLIRVEVNAGHGAGTPVSKVIEQTADIYAFTLWNMGYTSLAK